MTRRKTAAVAGVAFLAYIVVGIAQMLVGRGMSSGDTATARLASVAHHAAQLRINAVLGLSTSLMALILGATLYGLTRRESEELALLGFASRVGEGLLGALEVLASLALLWLATAQMRAASDGGEAMAGLLWHIKARLLPLGATFFAVGSTIFAGLMLRGRMIPAPLAWLGVLASVLLVVVLPMQLVGAIGSPLSDVVWIPMALFEVPLALWLIVRGAR